MSKPAIWWRPCFKGRMSDPTYRRRCCFVLQELRKHSWDVSEEDRGQPVIILQRFYNPDEIRRFQRAGRLVILETNDLHLYTIEPTFGNPNERESLVTGDYVVATCRWMQKVFARINPNCLIAHEALEDDFWATPRAILPDSPLVLSWQGTQSNLQYVEPIIEWMGDSGVDFVLRVVTADMDRGRSNRQRLATYPIKSEFVEWKLETWVAEIAKAHACIIPLPMTAFCSAKGHHKAIAAMALQLPCLASDMPGYREVIRHGETGLLAATPEQWQEGLRMLTDKNLREGMGKAGRDFSKHFTREAVGRTWDALLRGVCEHVGL